MNLNIVWISFAAGVCGTGLGGVLTAIIGRHAKKMIGSLLSFAAGVMASIVFFELIPEAFDHAGVTVVIIGMAIGIGLVHALNFILDRLSTDRKQEIHETYE
ncbi:MAG: hypothetical protein FWD16_06540, partial [Clostridia bacterium]|nr:hypothetical protein [Clostridia bacterium]